MAGGERRGLSARAHARVRPEQGGRNQEGPQLRVQLGRRGRHHREEEQVPEAPRQLRHAEGQAHEGTLIVYLFTARLFTRDNSPNGTLISERWACKRKQNTYEQKAWL